MTADDHRQDMLTPNCPRFFESLNWLVSSDELDDGKEGMP